MICGPCAYAADTRRPEWHERCESPASCSCQHQALGTGRPETPALPAEIQPAARTLSEEQQAALDSTGLTLSELRGRIQNWSADGQQLMVWGIVNMEAA